MINQMKRWLQFPPVNLAAKSDEEEENYEQNDSVSQVNGQIQDNDLEFLFHQLLEGVVNGWQENRIDRFLQKLQPKISLDVWLNWLQRYQVKLLSSPAPQTQIAARMIILGEITASLPFVRAIGDSAYQIGQKLLNREQKKTQSSQHPAILATVVEGNVEMSENIPPSKINSVTDIISMLQQNQELTSSPPLLDKELKSLDASVVMAEIAEQTQSNTQPVFSDSVYSLSADDLFSIALEKAQQGDLEKAISLWQEVVALDPNFAPAWHNLGSAFAYLNRLTEAVKSFDHAIALNVNDYLSWNDRGNALFRLQRWAEAIISWDRVIGIQPDFAEAWYYRGLAWEKLQQYSQAIESYEKCLVINPNFPSAKKHYHNLQALIHS